MKLICGVAIIVLGMKAARPKTLRIMHITNGKTNATNGRFAVSEVEGLAKVLGEAFDNHAGLVCDCQVDLKDVAKYVIDRVVLNERNLHKILLRTEIDGDQRDEVVSALAAAKDEIITFKEDRDERE